MASCFKVLQHEVFYMMGKALSGELSCILTGLVCVFAVLHSLSKEKCLVDKLNILLLKLGAREFSYPLKYQKADNKIYFYKI